MDRIGFSRQFSFESVRKDTLLLDEGIITYGICTWRTFIPPSKKHAKAKKNTLLLPILAAEGNMDQQPDRRWHAWSWRWTRKKERKGFGSSRITIHFHPLSCVPAFIRGVRCDVLIGGLNSDGFPLLNFSPHHIEWLTYACSIKYKLITKFNILRLICEMNFLILISLWFDNLVLQ